MLQKATLGIARSPLVAEGHYRQKKVIYGSRMLSYAAKDHLWQQKAALGCRRQP